MTFTPKQAVFIQEYLVDLNATQAAIRAGYAESGARTEGSRLLATPDIAAAVEDAMAARAHRIGITQDRVAAELARIGFANMLDYIRVPAAGDAYVDLTAMTRDQAAALAEVTVDEYTEGRGDDAREVKRVRIKLADKRAALVDLGRHLGMFRDKLEVTGNVSVAEQLAKARQRAQEGAVGPQDSNQ